MRPVVKWSLTAFAFVAMYVGAYIYVGRMLDQAIQPPTVQRVEPPNLGPRPPDLDGLALPPDADADAVQRAHDTLTRVGWRSELQPFDAQLAQAEAQLEANGHRALAARTLALRLRDLGDDAPPQLVERLATWRAETPEAFAWEQPPVPGEDDPDAPTDEELPPGAPEDEPIPR